jgi:U3 small nucleolar RNA-associated protein 22
MRQILLQDKDYLNHRYFNKRAYYLACLAAGIQSATGLKVNVEYGYQNSNRLQPIILVKPVIGKICSSYRTFAIR